MILNQSTTQKISALSQDIVFIIQNTKRTKLYLLERRFFSYDYIFYTVNFMYRNTSLALTCEHIFNRFKNWSFVDNKNNNNRTKYMTPATRFAVSVPVDNQNGEIRKIRTRMLARHTFVVWSFKHRSLEKKGIKNVWLTFISRQSGAIRLVGGFDNGQPTIFHLQYSTSNNNNMWIWIW